MSTRNIISLEFTPEQRQQIQEALNQLAALLDPHLMALTPTQRRAIKTMGDARQPFVAKVIEYTERNPELVPNYMDAAELRRDFEVVKQMTPYLRKMQQLVSNLDDTLFMCGAEAYNASLQYYQSVKLAARSNVPGAKAIHQDLKGLFEDMGPHTSKADEPTNTTAELSQPLAE